MHIAFRKVAVRKLFGYPSLSARAENERFIQGVLDMGCQYLSLTTKVFNEGIRFVPDAASSAGSISPSSPDSTIFDHDCGLKGMWTSSPPVSPNGYKSFLRIFITEKSDKIFLCISKQFHHRFLCQLLFLSTTTSFMF
jgi:hypothetical protein